ncbi:MAG: DUF4231 domain-containing protein [Anaerolineales bacterium]|nr:DUF4231 domain-containing protein [Chloroflexota bacterium]MBL6980024.1 DUF4231 domain-containing protein [Anaerolineales bacterium]
MIEYTSQNSLLETAWRRYAVLDANAKAVQNQYMWLRRFMASLGVLAVLFAILVDNFTDQVSAIVGIILRVLLILTPILISVFAAFTNKFQQGQKYLSYRAAAEGILKEIYIYRTANKNAANRDTLLSNRLASIQRDLFRGAGGELVLTEFKGDVPPYFYPDDERSDPGFTDLDGEKYLVYRLEDQLLWHTKKNLELQRDRKLIQWSILAFGGVGAFLAAWGGNLAIWVAFTASIASALIGWEELRGLDMRVGNYSQVILELSIIRDWWLTLRYAGPSQENAAQLAIKTEKVLYDQNLEWVSAMRKALAESEGDEAELVEHMIEEGREATAQLQEKLFTEVEELYDEGLVEAVDRVESVIEDSADSLRSMFAGITAIDEDDLDIPPEESFDAFEEAPETAFAESEIVEDDFYTPEPEPITVESAVDAALAESDAVAESMVTDDEEFFADVSEPTSVEGTVDAAIAESSLFSGVSEEGFSEDFSPEETEAEELVASASGEDLGEDFDDEDFGDDEEVEIDLDGDFVDEDFGEDDDEFGDETDFADEVWEDES